MFPKYPPPKGPSRTVFSTESDSVVFYYSIVNLLRIVIHYSKYSKSVQNIVIHYIFSSESVRVVNSLQIVNSLRVLFLVCRGPLGSTAGNSMTSSERPSPEPILKKEASPAVLGAREFWKRSGSLKCLEL